MGDSRGATGVWVSLSKGISGGDSILKFLLTMWMIAVDVDKIAHLVLVLDPLDALTDHQQTSETALVILWPFVTNCLARVEESSHGGAYGSDAAEEGFWWHASLILWYGTYEFLHRKKINLRTRCFFLF